MPVRKPGSKHRDQLNRLIEAHAALIQFGDSWHFQLPQKDGEEAIPLTLSENTVNRLSGTFKRFSTPKVFTRSQRRTWS